MYIILFILLFGLIGYWLATSRFSQPIDRTADAIAGKPRSWVARVQGRKPKSMSTGESTDPFILWATGEGTTYLPEDFKTWLSSLPPSEAGHAIQAMDEYAQGLGFRLEDLTQASLQARPALMQVYVEALTIYSQAYRKAKQANQAPEKTEEQVSANPPQGLKSNGKKDGKPKGEPVNSAETALSPAS